MKKIKHFSQKVFSAFPPENDLNFFQFSKFHRQQKELNNTFSIIMRFFSWRKWSNDNLEAIFYPAAKRTPEFLMVNNYLGGIYLLTKNDFQVTKNTLFAVAGFICSWGTWKTGRSENLLDYFSSLVSSRCAKIPGNFLALLSI